MNTIQDKSKASMGKVQDIDGDTKGIHENQTKSECRLGSKCICESVAKGCAVPVPDRTINLLEEAYDDWVANAVELDRLQAQTRRARKKNYELQTLTQETHKTRYAAMKREYDLALKKAQTEHITYGPPNKESSRRAKVIGKAWKRFRISLQSKEQHHSPKNNTIV